MPPTVSGEADGEKLSPSLSKVVLGPAKGLAALEFSSGEAAEAAAKKLQGFGHSGSTLEAKVQEQQRECSKR